MSVKLEIVPLSPSVEMFGSVHTSTSYSLSGHLLISVTPLPSLFAGTVSRPPSFRLTSLSVTFEGKAESLSPKIGYNGARICRIYKEIIGGAQGAPPKTLNCAGGDASEQLWQWSVLFDLSIPGWLPPTVDIAEYAETSYTLHASACLETLDPPSSYPQTHKASITTVNSASESSWLHNKSSCWSLGSLPSLLSAPFGRSKDRVVEAESVPITIVRLRIPPRPSTMDEAMDGASSLFHTIQEPATTMVFPSPTNPLESLGGISFSILSSLDIVAFLPEFVDVEQGVIPLGLKARCPVDTNQRLTLHGFNVEVNQVERFRSSPDSHFMNNFPVSPPSEQPPLDPLLNPNYMESLHSCGLLYPETKVGKVACIHQLIPEGRRVYNPCSGGVKLDQRWARMDVDVPILRPTAPRYSDEEDDEKEVDDRDRVDRRRRRALVLPDSRTPFSRVSHEIKVILKVSWDREIEEDCGDNELEEGSMEATKKRRIRHTENVVCSFPLCFTRVPTGRGSLETSPSYFSTTFPFTSPIDFPLAPYIASQSSALAASPTGSMFLPPSPTFGSVPHPTGSFLRELPVLPAYAQLFHENGERREEEDDDLWLPPYSKEHDYVVSQDPPSRGDSERIS